MTERQEIVLGARISKKLHEKILTEQKRLEKMTGIKPSINEVVRMLLEKGLEGRKR
jgi:hypothetical protein